MKRKITKKQFVEAVENNEDRLTGKQLAVKLGISEVHFCRLLKRYRNSIRDAAVELTKKIALKMVRCLEKNAVRGDTQAAKTVLEMAGAYVSRQKVDSTHKIEGVVVLPAEVPIGMPVEQKDD